jgi:tetratricopeptide (TPR) repeat protein
MRSHAAAALAILVIGAAAYSGSFDGGWVFDDVTSISENPTIRDLGNFAPGGPGYTARPTRYVAYLTFALNYRLGGLDAAGFHAVNLAIHVGCALLVYALVVLSFRTPRLRDSALASSAWAVALVASVLFVAHPLQTQAVAYVVQRLTSLAALFYLGATVAYVRWRLALAAGRVGTGGSIASYAGILLLAVLAMKTKEIAFTLPFAVALYELLFFDGPAAKRLLRLLPLAATAAIIPLTLLEFDRPVAEVMADASDATRVQTSISRLDYLRTQIAVVVTKYLALLVLPVGQNVDHQFPLLRSFLEPAALGSLAVVAGLGLLAAFLVRRTAPGAGSARLDPALRLAAYGILWFFLALSVESTVIPIVDLVFEHRVYLPSVGFFVAVAVGLVVVGRRWARHRAVPLSVAVGMGIAVVLAAATFQRNEVWTSELTLWSDAAAKSPTSRRSLTNLGAALQDSGRSQEAERVLTTAVRLRPWDFDPIYNLGRVYLVGMARYEEADALFRRAMALRPDSADARANLASTLVRLGRYEEVVQVVEAGGALLQNSAEARFNAAVALAMLGRHEEARAESHAVRRLSPQLSAQLDAFLRSQGPSAPPGPGLPSAGLRR